MQIALLGGTGDIGEGLALRWAYDTGHGILIGSREPDRARAKAAEYETELDSRGLDRTVEGLGNAEAAARADVVVLSVPARYARGTVRTVRDGLEPGTVLVSPAVGMSRDEDGFHYDRPGAGSVAEVVDAAAPADVPVVGAFHNLAADRLANLDSDLDLDVLVVGDDPDAKETVATLAGEIAGIRALDAGALPVAAEVEAVTPLLVNVAVNNEGLHDLGVKFQ